MLPETLRQPAWIITGLATPVLYLALFAPLLRSLPGGPAFPHGHVLDVFVPGIMVLIAFGAGMGAVFGYHVHWGGLALLPVLLALLTAACSATSTALGLVLKEIGSLAAGTVGGWTVGVGFLITGSLAALALTRGTRSCQRAMAWA